MNTKLIEKKYNEYLELVPIHGKADNLAIELIRALNRIEYKFYNDGDMIGCGYGKGTCNAPARFIIENVDDNAIIQTIKYIWGLDDKKIYESNLSLLKELLTEYIVTRPELQNMDTDDMFDYYIKSEDEDDYDEIYDNEYIEEEEND